MRACGVAIDSAKPRGGAMQRARAACEWLLFCGCRCVRCDVPPHKNGYARMVRRDPKNKRPGIAGPSMHPAGAGMMDLIVYLASLAICAVRRDTFRLALFL